MNVQNMLEVSSIVLTTCINRLDQVSRNMCEIFRCDVADSILIIIYQLCASLIVCHIHSLRTLNKNVRESYKQGSGLSQSLRNNNAAKTRFRLSTFVS